MINKILNLLTILAIAVVAVIGVQNFQRRNINYITPTDFRSSAQILYQDQGSILLADKVILPIDHDTIFN